MNAPSCPRCGDPPHGPGPFEPRSEPTGRGRCSGCPACRARALYARPVSAPPAVYYLTLLALVAFTVGWVLAAVSG